MEDKIVMKIDRKIASELREIGKKGETYSQVFRRLLDIYYVSQNKK